MLKAYLSTQPSPLSAFMISKTQITAQKPGLSNITVYSMRMKLVVMRHEAWE